MTDRLLIESSERNKGFFYVVIEDQNGNKAAAYINDDTLRRIQQLVNREAETMLGEPLPDGTIK